MKVTQRKVTPKLAGQWLGYNTRNRHVRLSVVAGYAKAMQDGEWKTDIDPVAFAGELAGKNGSHPVLLNGQHRLHAIVESGVTIPLLVIEGLTIADQTEMDTGTKRQLADQLRLRGVSMCMEMASILRMVHLYEQGKLRSKSAVTPSFSAMLRRFDEHPDMVDVLTPARKLYAAIGGRLSVYGCAYWVLSQLDDPHVDADLDDWWHLLVTGESLAAGHPALAFRNAVLNTGQATSTRRRLTQVHLLALSFKAWNLYRDGGRLATLTWRGGGRNPETFPVPH